MKKRFTVLLLFMSLMVTACQNNEKSLEQMKQELEKDYENKRKNLQQDKEELMRMVMSLEKSLEVEQEKAISLEDELNMLKEKYGIRGENDYSKNDLILLAIQDYGKLTYRFIEYVDSKSIEKEKGKQDIENYNASEGFSLNHYLYFLQNGNVTSRDYTSFNDGISEYYYIPDSIDYKIIMEGEDIPFPEEYQNQKIFSYDDLVTMENILNDEEYDIYSAKEKKYLVDDLALVDFNGKLLFFDKENMFIQYNSNPETIKNLYYYEYWIGVTDKNVALKHKGRKNLDPEYGKESYVIEFDDISCTNYKTYRKYMNLIDWKYQNIVIEEDVSKYFSSDTVTDKEIKQVERNLNRDYSLRFMRK